VSAGAVIGVDPGRVKAGYAVLDSEGRRLDSGICAVDGLRDELARLVSLYAPLAIALGRGTNAKPVAQALGALGVPIHWVDEYETTRRARELFFADHPPSGWRRLIPLGLLTPGRPIDDYAAILIGRRYLSASSASTARGDA
jgi:RNase H-fold protein (predicted Holliday junction resolvase)